MTRNKIILEPLAGIIDIDPATQKPVGVATSHSRCIHLTNPENRTSMFTRYAQKRGRSWKASC